MSETAAVQVNRLVQLVAELSRRDDEDGEGVPIADVAERLGVSATQVERDIRTLTAVSDNPDGSWLQSLSIWQEGDRFSASSLGPYRRPLRFTPMEMLAIQVGLAWEMEGGAESAVQGVAPLTAEFAKLLSEASMGPDQVSITPLSGEGEQDVVELAQRAVAERRVLTILYTAEGDLAGAARSVEPHQVAYADGRWYAVAWCRKSEGWRHFRADRVIDAALEEETFTPRSDFKALEKPEEAFRQDAPPVPVRVRFRPAVARWLAERYPEGRALPDGGLEVEFAVLDPHWLVRHILQYGADAEVIEPPAVRALMKKILGVE
jgi:predicted DNA-binding transcriptional regulator YafY